MFRDGDIRGIVGKRWMTDMLSCLFPGICLLLCLYGLCGCFGCDLVEVLLFDRMQLKPNLTTKMSKVAAWSVAESFKMAKDPCLGVITGNCTHVTYSDALLMLVYEVWEAFYCSVIKDDTNKADIITKMVLLGGQFPKRTQEHGIHPWHSWSSHSVFVNFKLPQEPSCGSDKKSKVTHIDENKIKN